MKSVACVLFLLLSSVNIFGQWVQTSGPSGGGVSDFATVNGKILAATFDIGNGIYASTDNGSSWFESGLQGSMLTHIAASGNTVITASTENLYNETDMIYRSNDGGLSWQNVLSLPNINGVRSICHFKQQWYFTSEGKEGGLYHSDDDGVTWVVSKPAHFSFSHAVPLVSSPTFLLAGTEDAGVPTIFLSVDGQTWTQAINGPDSDLHKQMYCGSVSGNVIWLGITGGAIYSADNGNSWSFPANRNLQQHNEYFTSLTAVGNHLVALSSLNNIYYSWNGAVDWTKASVNGLPVNASYFFSLALSDTTYFLGASSGILRSLSQGSSWQYDSQGLRTAAVTQLASSGGKIFAATERGVSYTSDGGMTWHDPQNISDLNDIPISGFYNAGNSFYAYGDGIYSINGTTWSTIDTNTVTNLIEGASGRLFVSRQSDDPIAGKGGLLKSDNGGVSWDSLLIFVNTFDTEYYFVPNCIASSGASIVGVMKSINFQNFSSSYIIYHSTDNGSSWSTNDFANAPDCLYYADNELYMGTSDHGLFRSRDNGATWAAVGFNSKAAVTAILRSGSSFFVSVSGNGDALDGIYSSREGSSWHFANSGTANIFGPLCSDGTYLYSGGPSVWKRPLNELGVSDPKKNVQAAAIEIFPNPSAKIIHFHILAELLSAKIVISDEKGTVVYSKDINEGDLSISVAGFAEGIYFAKLIDRSGFVIGSDEFVVQK